DGDIFHSAVDLVGRGKEDRRVDRLGSCCFEDVESTECVHLEVEARVRYGRRYGNLSGQMVNLADIAGSLQHRAGIPDVPFDDLDIVRVVPRQPLGVPPNTQPGEIIEDAHPAALAGQRMGEIGADESGAS